MRLDTFSSGLLSGAVIPFVLQPLDVVKTRMQGASAMTSYRGFFTTLVLIPRQEGLKSLWRGAGTSMVRTGFGHGLWRVLLEPFRTHFGSSDIANFSSAAAARAVVDGIMCPLAVIKTRLEAAHSPHYTGMITTARVMVKQEGVVSLYSGLLPTIIRDVPYMGVNYMVYEKLKFFFRSTPSSASSSSSVASAGLLLSSTAMDIVFGFISGTIATTISTPFDVVKTRLQLQTRDISATASKDVHYSGFRQSLQRIYKEEGLNGFFKGNFSRVMRKSLSSALTFALFDLLRNRHS